MSNATNENENIRITKKLLSECNVPTTAAPSEFIEIHWKHYKTKFKSNNALNGAIFENLITLALARAGISNIYTQTEITFVPSAIFDIFLYTTEGSYALSIKTTLRERWKQADLEALAIKQVHKDCSCYVITLAKQEVGARRRNDSTYAGINGFILADTSEFDDLVSELQEKTFTIAGDIPIVKKSLNVYDKGSILKDFDYEI